MGRVFLIFTVVLFAAIGFAAIRKSEKKSSIVVNSEKETTVEIVTPKPAPPAPKPVEPPPPEVTQDELPRPAGDMPTADRISELFNVYEPKLPIVETVTYKSHTAWQKGRPAWIADYASHYETSRHFIARSLNGKPDYFKQDISDGKRFNVLHPEKELKFHMVVDLSRCKLLLWAVDASDNKNYLLKTYDVGLGRFETNRPSGSLTPLGVYTLGKNIAIYKPKVTGFYNGEKTEMIKIFGTRWIPFDEEVSDVTAPAKGFGIHGVPWIEDPQTGTLAEQRESIRKYDSDGCIRLLTEDIEEIFSIVITKPTTIEIVKDFHEAKHLR